MNSHFISTYVSPLVSRIRHYQPRPLWSLAGVASWGGMDFGCQAGTGAPARPAWAWIRLDGCCPHLSGDGAQGAGVWACGRRFPSVRRPYCRSAAWAAWAVDGVARGRVVDGFGLTRVGETAGAKDDFQYTGHSGRRKRCPNFDPSGGWRKTLLAWPECTSVPCEGPVHRRLIPTANEKSRSH